MFFLMSTAHADDADMYDDQSAQNVVSQHVVSAPIIRSEPMGLNQNVPDGLQQNRSKEQDLPPFDALHDGVAYHNVIHYT
jgi:hypothetical protein